MFSASQNETAQKKSKEKELNLPKWTRKTKNCVIINLSQCEIPTSYAVGRTAQNSTVIYSQKH